REAFLPVKATLSALIMITKSPVSRFGVYVGLFLPRKIVATALDKRPKGTSVASTTYHLRSTSPDFAKYVVRTFISSIYDACLTNNKLTGPTVGQTIPCTIVRFF